MVSRLNTQRRRLKSESFSNNDINDNTNPVEIILDEGPSVNAHGLRFCFSIEPEVADANANGFWLMLCLPASVLTSADLPDSFADLEDESFLPYVWGVGCWTASNQAPYHYEFAPSTSRTCQKGARLRGYVVKTGISAGAVRINETLTCFTSN